MLMQYFKIKKATARYKHYNVLVIRDRQNILLDCTKTSTNVPFLELIFNKQLCFTLFNLIGFDPPFTFPSFKCLIPVSDLKDLYI